ncbi:MAG: polysaccharide biosynthesis protein, partial [Clostridia bacterium]|nr:polysaccharide biosynthesis protein [Clostridia bacterium]
MILSFISNIKPIRRRLLLYLIDAGIICASFFFGLICYFLPSYPSISLLNLFAELLLIASFQILIEILCKLNNIIWHYAGVHEYLYLIIISICSGLLGSTLSYFILRHPTDPIYYLFSIVLCTSLLTLSRILYREFRNAKRKYIPASDAKRLLIIGAGAAGSRLLDEIRTSPSCGLVPVGFIDNNPQKYGRSIDGVYVLGTLDELENICEEERIDTIYLAIPSIDNEQRSVILQKCLKTPCSVKTLPVLSEINDKKNLIGNLRSITPEELLGREPVSVADNAILDFVHGKTVIITGGGGSIGSEICRQIASNEPKRLVIIDVYENNAYSIQQELIRKYGADLNLEVFIATVCDFKKINAIFASEKPDIVIHAAAHKHVPLMETVPDEAVKNNVFGTFNTVMAARENKVKKMILISTDKAVNPTNIMGATKRMCEMIIQYADSVSPDTTFAAVRFGNVLGSNGSVIPLFKKQIEEHHDLTVTHPEMIRYFMTISEASQLVLTASAMANGGEIFVLDMGEPVKIDDLARNMIRLAGLTLGKDINIRYIGLRPGEKLYEELLMSEEGLNQT